MASKSRRPLKDPQAPSNNVPGEKFKAGDVRIIGGEWRRRVIRFPGGEGLRPTPDRVRETLFNWLGQTLDGQHCLDLFAGSGALGLEARSRGARPVVLVERAKPVARQLMANIQALDMPDVEVVQADAVQFLTRDRRRFHIVFLDPPYGADYLPRMWTLLPPRLLPGALVYAESGTPLELPAGWNSIRSGKAGQIHYYLLEQAEDTMREEHSREGAPQ